MPHTPIENGPPRAPAADCNPRKVTLDIGHAHFRAPGIGAGAGRSDRNRSAVGLSDGSVRNACTMEPRKKSMMRREFVLRAERAEATLDVVGAAGHSEVETGPDGSAAVRAVPTMRRRQPGAVGFVAQDKASCAGYCVEDSFVTN
jgi:hypothetical protein